ncbi:MAG TPA: M23 family metallopeptidase [Spirochaetota bacterium]
MKKIFFSAMLILSLSPISSEERLSLIWPVDRPVQLSGSFAEFRGSRFHHGIDIGCDGEKGFRVFASAAGSVAEVIYQNYGIGYCVVLRHSGGFTTLYGHLESFAQKILDNPKIKAHQTDIDDHCDFRVNLSDGEIPVTQGETIAYTGNSGIGPEHLHFELADSSDNPVNPLRMGLPVPDYLPPVIERIYLIPLDGSSTINGSSDTYEIPTVKIKGKRVLKSNDAVRIAGRIGVMIDAYDLSGGKNHIGIYRGIVSHNGTRQKIFSFDRIKSEESRQCALLYDIADSTFSRYRYFLYNRATGEGIVNVTNGPDSQTIDVIAADASDNECAYSLSVVRDREPQQPLWKRDINTRSGKSSAIASSDKKCTIEIPQGGTIYDESISVTEDQLIDHSPKGIVPLSRAYKTQPADLCAVKPFQVVFPIDEKESTHTGIYSIGRNGVIRAEYSWYDKKRHALIASAWKLSSFFVARDEAPPVVRSPKRILIKGEIFIRVSDTGSGIDPRSVRILVDGKPVKFYHDPDQQSFIILPHNVIWDDGDHIITASISDCAGNRSDELVVHYETRPGMKFAKIIR